MGRQKKSDPGLDESQLLQEFVVIRVGADPIPDHRVIGPNTDGTVADADSG
jgi:hypothetical protein